MINSVTENMSSRAKWPKSYDLLEALFVLTTVRKPPYRLYYTCTLLLVTMESRSVAYVALYRRLVMPVNQ